MKTLRREDVVGSRILKVEQTFTVVDDWLDSISTYFTNDRGFIFRFPLRESVWCESKIPLDAKPLIGRDAATILNRLITGVFIDPEGDPAESIIQLDDGRCLSEFSTAPHGVGATRLYIRTADQASLSKKLDIFAR